MTRPSPASHSLFASWQTRLRNTMLRWRMRPGLMRGGTGSVPRGDGNPVLDVEGVASPLWDGVLICKQARGSATENTWSHENMMQPPSSGRQTEPPIHERGRLDIRSPGQRLTVASIVSLRT